MVTYENVFNLIEAIYEPYTRFENARDKIIQYKDEIAKLESSIKQLEQTRYNYLNKLTDLIIKLILSNITQKNTDSPLEPKIEVSIERLETLEVELSNYYNAQRPIPVNSFISWWQKFNESFTISSDQEFEYTIMYDLETCSSIADNLKAIKDDFVSSLGTQKQLENELRKLETKRQEKISFSEDYKLFTNRREVEEDLTKSLRYSNFLKKLKESAPDCNQKVPASELSRIFTDLLYIMKPHDLFQYIDYYTYLTPFFDGIGLDIGEVSKWTSTHKSLHSACLNNRITDSKLPNLDSDAKMKDVLGFTPDVFAFSLADSLYSSCRTEMFCKAEKNQDSHGYDYNLNIINILEPFIKRISNSRTTDFLNLFRKSPSIDSPKSSEHLINLRSIADKIFIGKYNIKSYHYWLFMGAISGTLSCTFNKRESKELGSLITVGSILISLFSYLLHYSKEIVVCASKKTDWKTTYKLYVRTTAASYRTSDSEVFEWKSHVIPLPRLPSQEDSLGRII